MEKINLSVLFVEDDKLTREYVHKMLDLTVKEHHVASDGKEAVNMIVNEKYLPDVIITDLKMPGVNGLDLISLVEKIENYHPKILLITGHSEIETIQELLQSYNIEVFQKPIDFRDIINCLKNIRNGWSIYGRKI